MLLYNSTDFALAVLVGGSLFLVGCACPPDPREGGLLCGTKNLLDNTYEERIAARKIRLGEERARSDEFAARAEHIRARRQQVTRQLTEAQGRLSRLKQETTALSARLRDQEMARDFDRVRLSKLQSELENVQMDLDSLEKREQPAEQLLSEIQEIQQYMDSLSKVSRAISGKKQK